MKIKKTIISFLILILVVSFQLIICAHSGNTDWRGGHRDNKNKSGLGYYHYHCGGYPPHLHSGGVCPYKASSTSKTYIAPKIVYATKITAVNVPAIINAGEITQLKGEVYPSDAQDKTIEWKSNNPEIVTVTPSGKLYAVGVGKATVTAATSRGTETTFTITVKEVFAEGIEIIFPAEETETNKLAKGKQIELKAVITPENTTDKTVKWSVSDTSIAKIDKNGKLTAIGSGTVTVTAATSNKIETKVDIEIYSYTAVGVVGGFGAAAATYGVWYFIRKRKKIL